LSYPDNKQTAERHSTHAYHSIRTFTETLVNRYYPLTYPSVSK